MSKRKIENGIRYWFNGYDGIEEPSKKSVYILTMILAELNKYNLPFPDSIKLSFENGIGIVWNGNDWNHYIEIYNDEEIDIGFIVGKNKQPPIINEEIHLCDIGNKVAETFKKTLKETNNG